MIIYAPAVPLAPPPAIVVLPILSVGAVYRVPVGAMMYVDEVGCSYAVS